jgi:hypothetical protein
MTHKHVEALHQILKGVDGLMFEDAQSQLIHEVARELQRVLETVIVELDHRANLRSLELRQSRDRNGFT